MQETRTEYQPALDKPACYTANRSLATGYFALFALLVSLYTLTNAGRFHIIDEVSIFAVTDSLVLRSEVNTNAIAWTQWVNSPGEVLGAFGEQGNVYSKKGPGPAFVAVPWYLLLRGFALLDMDIGMLQGMMLWNGIVTAATALLLWNTATRLGYSQQVGCGLGLLFGLGTIAWPYANMLFGEPLSAFALLLCFWGLMAWRQVGRNRFAFVGGMGAALAIATVTAHAPIVAAFALLALVSMVRHGVPVPEYARRPGAGRPKDDPTVHDDVSTGAVGVQDGGADNAEDESSLATLRFGIQVGLFLGPVMLAILFIFIYNAVRFGSGFDTGYHFDSGEGFSTPLLEGLWGLLISPYRGVFWHTPLFILSLFSLPVFLRRHRLEAASIVAGSALLIGLYSMWWMWWGGFAWGPRFLVPFAPFWVLLLAPVVAASLGRVRGESDAHATGVGRARSWWMELSGGWRMRPLGWVLLVFALLSTVVQVAAVSANFVNFEIELRGRYPTEWDDPLAYGPPALSLARFMDSPVIGQFQLLFSGQSANLDFAWIWPDGDVRWLIVVIGGAAVLTILLILGKWLLRMAPGGAWAPSGPLVWLLLVLPALVMAVWLGELSRHPHYGTSGAGYRAIVEEICAHADADDVIVTVAPFAYQIPMNWLGAECRAQPHILGYAANSLEHVETDLALTRALEDHRRVWFVTGGLAPNDPDNLLERRLSETVHKAQDTWYDDYRLVLYGASHVLNEAPWFPIATPLVGRGTSQIVVLAARMPDVVQAGDVLATEIYYELGAPSPNNLRWFVQLLAESGEPVALLDTAPQDGYVSFVDLPAEQEVMERAGIWIPPDTPTGDYSLIAGLYNPDDPEAARLRAPNGNDHVVMGVVRVIGEQD
ncbi:MAG: hypothetical protein WDZ49_09560 [Litorilinea sp.]